MFNSEAKLDEIDGRPGWWRLSEPLIYTVEYDGVLIEVVVPKGFPTNLASTPRVLWPILPPFGTYTRATILHDYLYTVANRFLADALFRVAMQELGTCLLARIAMFYAVRLFGGKYADAAD